MGMIKFYFIKTFKKLKWKANCIQQTKVTWTLHKALHCLPSFSKGPLYFFFSVKRDWDYFFLVKRDLGFFIYSWFVIAHIWFCVNVNEFWELSMTCEQSQYFYVNAFCKVVLRGPSFHVMQSLKSGTNWASSNMFIYRKLNTRLWTD